MNYIGSKVKLLPFIKELVGNVVEGDLKDKVFCDIFAGTSIVGKGFKKDVKKVISNDLEHYSYILNKNYIENGTAIKDAQSYIDKLSNLPLITDGFIYQNYCNGSGSGRQYFSDENGKKIDTIRAGIEEWRRSGYIDMQSYYFLLASLIESADKIANTASVYGAYLKKLKKNALKDMVLEPAWFDESSNVNEVFNEDSNELIKRIEGDILYIDPPYNHRQYGSNYHILNTIVLYDDFMPKGVSGMREYGKSSYCKNKRVEIVFEELIRKANFEYIFLSYNNEGLMSKEDIKKIMSKCGNYSLAKKEYQRFKADKSENRIHKTKTTTEFIHVLKK